MLRKLGLSRKVLFELEAGVYHLIHLGVVTTRNFVKYSRLPPICRAKTLRVDLGPTFLSSVHYSSSEYSHHTMFY